MTTWRARARSAWQRHAERCLLALAALALGASLLRPGAVIERARFEHVVVLDITQSMNVQDEAVDGRPLSRLAFAKHALRESLLRLPCGSKLGWAVFTEYRSYLLLAPVEVCANLSELRATLARIDGRMAWTGNSEIAKGVHSALGIARQIAGTPSLVFVTDGHESPPLNPLHRPAFDDKPGEVGGLIVGVGALEPSPIPKTDTEGRPLGFWRADEVMQTEPHSQRRGDVPTEEALGQRAARALEGTPGSEHLSALHETYLRLLAAEQGLAFHRLRTPQALGDALMAPRLARPVPVRADLRPALAALALCLLLARHAGWIGAWVRNARRRPASLE